jgi:hypothetical protein
VRKGTPYGLIIEKDGYFPYYAENTIPLDLPETKVEKNIILPDDLKNDFTLFYPESDTVLGEKSKALLVQLTDLLIRQPTLVAWFDPQGDSLDFARINRLTAALRDSGISATRLLTGNQPDSSGACIRIGISTSPENAVLMQTFASELPADDLWTIQFSASKTPLSKKAFKGLEPVHEFRGKDGFYRYSYGTFKNRAEATAKLSVVKKKGFAKPFAKQVSSIKKL